MTKEYTNPELRAFERELIPFWETRTLSTGEKIKVVNFNEYYKAQKIMRYHPTSKDWAIREDRLKNYIDTEEKIMALSKLKGRTEFAKKKEAEHLDSLR